MSNDLSPTEQIDAARTASAVAVLPRGFVRVEGPDAESHLQAVLSQDVAGIAPGSARYGLLLTPKARVLADPRVLRIGEESFLLDVDPVGADVLEKHLLRYRLRAQAEIERADDRWRLLAVTGPDADDVVQSTLGSVPGPIEGDGVSGPPFALRALPIRVPRIDIVVAADDGDTLLDRLRNAGATAVNPEAIEALRIEAGVPRLGAEADERWMPAECGLVERAVSFDKGCYIGQEPVTRLHRRGHANRGPRRLLPAAPVAVGDSIVHDGKEVGVVTSTCAEPWLERPAALGIVRVEVPTGARVEVGSGITAETA